MTTGAILGYLVLTVAAFPIAWLAWHHRSDPENPSLVLLITWVVAGITHSFVHNLWRACKIAAFASVVIYTLLIVFLNALNEMLVAGMMLVGAFGYVLALVMGIPVAMKTASFLGDRFRVIAPDLWGFGLTESWTGEGSLTHEPILTPLLKLAGEEEAFREYLDMAQAFLTNAAADRLEDAWRGFIDYRNGRGSSCGARSRHFGATRRVSD